MRQGDTLCFENPPVIRAFAAVGGKREAGSPLKEGFDRLCADNYLGKPSWEQAEQALQTGCLEQLLAKAGLGPGQVDLVFAGDLQAQCTASSYTMRGLDAPFAGLYGACSTMAEALGLAACMAAAGLGQRVLALTSSHFCAAERQFRTPLDYGGKRTPTAQWTATAAGGCLVSPSGEGVRVKRPAMAFGRVRDYGVKDINNTWGRPWPRRPSRLSWDFFEDTGARAEEFDCLYTGDLGRVGSRLLARLAENEGLALPPHRDCGCLLYGEGPEAVGAGGSGAGCSASVLTAHILPRLLRGEEKRVLFVATGALMSQTTFLQRESIPCIAHLVELGEPRRQRKGGRTMNFVWAFLVGGAILRGGPAAAGPAPA